MSDFAETIKKYRSISGDGEGIEYFYPFINQFAKIPKTIADKVNNDYSNEKVGVRYCIGLILTNMLKHGIISYSRSGRYYAEHKGKYYTKANIINAVDLLVKDKYVFNVGGYKDSRFDSGISSSLRPLEKLYQDYPKVSNLSLNFKTIPPLQIDKNGIYTLVDLKKYVTQAKPSINTSTIPISSFQPSNLSHNGTLYARYFSESKDLNWKYYNKMKLDFSNIKMLKATPLDQVALTRIFNNGECGRWYQKGGLSYQQLPKTARAQILLNGSEVAELDYSAMHPHILYAWEDRQCPVDFYKRIAKKLNLEYTDDVKFVVKRVALSSVNASDKTDLSKSISYDKLDEVIANKTRRNEGRDEKLILYDELKRLHIGYKKVVEAFKKAHPTIANYIYSNSATKLMLVESNIMTSVLLELKSLKIPAIPVHDSVIVPMQYKERTKAVMESCYKKHTGYDIPVK